MLKWHNIEKIARALNDNNPDEDIEHMSYNNEHDLEHILDMVVELDDFEDDHIFQKHQKQLQEILRHWKELKSAH